MRQGITTSGMLVEIIDTAFTTHLVRSDQTGIYSVMAIKDVILEPTRK